MGLKVSIININVYISGFAHLRVPLLRVDEICERFKVLVRRLVE